MHFVADNTRLRVRVFANRGRIDSHGHRKSCTRIVTSQSMSQWSGRLVPGDSRKSDWRGMTRVFAYRRNYSITFPRLAYRSPIHRGCIVRPRRRHCHRRHRRNRQNAASEAPPSPLALSLSVRHAVFYGELLRPSANAFRIVRCRIPSGDLILSPAVRHCALPLVPATDGSRWKCNSWCPHTKRVK